MQHVVSVFVAAMIAATTACGSTEPVGNRATAVAAPYSVSDVERAFVAAGLDVRRVLEPEHRAPILAALVPEEESDPYRSEFIVVVFPTVEEAIDYRDGVSAAKESTLPFSEDFKRAVVYRRNNVIVFYGKGSNPDRRHQVEAALDRLSSMG